MPSRRTRKHKGNVTQATARRGTIGAVEHAIDLLRCLSEAGSSLGTNDIARRIGIHKSSVSRLAGTLEKARLVQRESETGRLSLGAGLVALAAPVLASFEARDLVRPLLEELAKRTGETASFSIWDGHEAVSIEQVASSNSVQAFSRPGHRNPAHATAVGKILLAHMSDIAIEKYCSEPLRRFTDRTVTDAAALKAELKRCRAQRYAFNMGEFEIDVGAASAVTFDSRSQVLGAMTVTVPMYRFQSARRKELAAIVCHYADELSSKLGFSMGLRKAIARPHPDKVV
jgi:DNA-binding IclR family transcriptional regulator